MSLLLPDTGLLFWMTLSFGIVFFLLAKFAFPLITQQVEKRNKYIRESLEAAREAEEKLATLNKQAEVILEKARKEQKALLDEALEAKKQVEAEAREEAEAEARLLIQKATGEIETAKAKALGEIREQIIDLSMRIAEKIVNEELKSNKTQTGLINQLLKEKVNYKA